MPDISLLIADDEPIARLFIRRLVEREHAPVSAVFEAANGLEAVELARRHQPDLALIDIRMPEMDGLQAAQAILQQQPETCVVIVTAHEDFDYARTALRAGIADYLLKPARVADVLARIQAVHAAKNARMQNAWPERPQHPLVAAVAAYVRQHLAENLSLTVLSKAVFVSPAHLSRTFKKYAGMALTEFIVEERLRKAKELLAGSRLSMSEIAECTGFATSAYFSACFRKKNGEAPSCYRQARG